MDVALKGTPIVGGIPPEIKAALGVEDGIVEKVTIVYTNHSFARITVDYLPRSGNALAEKATGGTRWVAVKDAV